MFHTSPRNRVRKSAAIALLLSSFGVLAMALVMELSSSPVPSLWWVVVPWAWSLSWFGTMHVEGHGKNLQDLSRRSKIWLFLGSIYQALIIGCACLQSTRKVSWLRLSL